MKKLLIVLVFIIALSPVFAERSIFAQDIGIRAGHGAFLNGDGGLHVLGGLTIGLSERLEFNPEVIVQVMPDPFKSLNLGFEIGYSLLGNRVNKTDIAGPILNTVLCFGCFTDNLKPRYLTLRVVPLTLGTPFSGKRENFFPVGVAYDLQDKKFSCFFSIAIYDYYIKGTWAQLRGE